MVQLLTGNNEHLAWSHTLAQSGHEGEYEFDPVDNPGAEGIKVFLYTATYYGANDQLACVYNGGSDYSDAYIFPTNTYWGLDGSETTYEFDPYTVPEYDNDIDSCWIKNDLQRGYD